jgi:hypothetical protein
MTAVAVAGFACVAAFTSPALAAGRQPGADRVVAGGTWGTAEELPGSAALNNGGLAAVKSVSCASAGNCSAGGDYTQAPGGTQALVATETKGIWRNAEPVPGSAILNKHGNATIGSISCAAPGNCSAGGIYTDRNATRQVFVADEVNGTWGKAEEAPGSAALNQGIGSAAGAEINSISCATPGNCSAGGDYTNANGAVQAFVVSETSGTWRKAEEVPGTAARNKGGLAEIGSVSCAAAGYCSAGGFYKDGAGHDQAFVVDEVNGVWRTVREIPGTAALNQGGNAHLQSLSCASAGNCSAGGFYKDGTDRLQAFEVSQTNGTWGTAREVPGTAALNKGTLAEITSVSCAAAGNCSAGGEYTDGSGGGQAFVVSQTNRTWGTAREVPGTAALNKAGFAQLTSVSCAAAGNCSAGGDYASGPGKSQTFVVSQTNGTWGTAHEVPGTAALNKGGFAQLTSVSCAAVAHCSAGGYYIDSSAGTQAFVVNET